MIWDWIVVATALLWSTLALLYLGGWVRGASRNSQALELDFDVTWFVCNIYCPKFFGAVFDLGPRAKFVGACCFGRGWNQPLGDYF